MIHIGFELFVIPFSPFKMHQTQEPFKTTARILVEKKTKPLFRSVNYKEGIKANFTGVYNRFFYKNNLSVGNNYCNQNSGFENSV